ncbi:MAG: hypothetical protein IKR30_03810 [Bacteroidales bacterium]|nr:hypothetical protein [Bacteroidales bacterium]
MEEKNTPLAILKVHKDGSCEIDLPKDSFELLKCMEVLSTSLSDYCSSLPKRQRAIFIMSELLAHETFATKTIKEDDVLFH